MSATLSALYRQRILAVLWNMLKQTVVPVLGLLLSWVITKKFSIELWGAVTQITLWVSIIIHLSSWGNTEYLLKEFSAQPGKLKLRWQSCFIDRLPVLLITCCGILVYYRDTLGIIMVFWCLIEFIYQSYEPVINFYKRFMISVIAEVAGAIVLFILLFAFRVHIDLFLIIALLTIADLCKTIVVIVYFSKDLLPFKTYRPDAKYYTNALSFFLLGFVGLLYSKADLIYVTAYMNHHDIAFYQIATNFFSFAKSGASMLILPFVPVLYRLKKNLVDTLSIRFTTMGIGLSIFSFIVIYFILTIGYKFEVGFPFILAGFLSIIPAFYSYSIVIFLFKHNKQNKVVSYGVVGILLTLLFNALLVPHFGITGAIIASTLAQWAVIPLYLYEMNTIKAKA
ncbi:MAG TPA: polysaccharide biosynthesis C-terminal domain-containing protein [Bacteroidia bacterium]|nr:polysaccharide biosynthesis C-terminal domain-containing protein [Bacteroidia bacterium]